LKHYQSVARHLENASLFEEKNCFTSNFSFYLFAHSSAESEGIISWIGGFSWSPSQRLAATKGINSASRTQRLSALSFP